MGFQISATPKKLAMKSESVGVSKKGINHVCLPSAYSPFVPKVWIWCLMCQQTRLWKYIFFSLAILPNLLHQDHSPLSLKSQKSSNEVWLSVIDLFVLIQYLMPLEPPHLFPPTLRSFHRKMSKGLIFFPKAFTKYFTKDFKKIDLKKIRHPKGTPLWRTLEVELPVSSPI